MVGFDELKNKAADALGDEEKTDRGLDKAANFLSEKTGGQHDDKIQKGRDFLDDKVGDEGGEGDAQDTGAGDRGDDADHGGNEGEAPNENVNRG